MSEDFGATFHRTFSFSRNVISQILEYLSVNKKLSKSNLIKDLKLGATYAEAYPRYSKMAGLIESNSDNLSKFGKLVSAYDSKIEDINTLWLIHYFFGTPYGLSPKYWKGFIADKFYNNGIFNRQDLNNLIGELYFQQEQKLITSKMTVASANVFLKSYIDNDGLGKLNILNKIDDSLYEVTNNRLENALVFGFALSHYWQTVHPNATTLNISDITESSLAKLFFLSPAQAEALLEELRYNGFVEIHRTAPPYQVVLRKNGDWALEQLFKNTRDA